MAIDGIQTVYILRCVDESYYTGKTHDLERRLAEHHEGFYPDCYTFRRRPVTLVFFEEFPDAAQAFEFERRIKKWTRVKKEALIARDWDKLKEHSKRRGKSGKG